MITTEREPRANQLVIPGIIDFERLDFVNQDRLQAAVLAVGEMRNLDQETRLLASGIDTTDRDNPWRELQIITSEPIYIAAEFALSGYVKARTLVEALRQPDFLQESVVDLGSSPFVSEDRRILKDIEKPSGANNVWFYGSYVAEIISEVMSVASHQVLSQMRNQNSWGKEHDFRTDLANVAFLSQEGQQMGLAMSYSPYSRAAYPHNKNLGTVHGFGVKVEFGVDPPGISRGKDFVVSANWEPQTGDYKPERMSWKTERKFRDKPGIMKTEKIVMSHNWVIGSPWVVYWTQETVDHNSGATDIVLMRRMVDSLGDVSLIGEDDRYVTEKQELQKVFHISDEAFESSKDRISIV